MQKTHIAVPSVPAAKQAQPSQLVVSPPELRAALDGIVATNVPLVTAGLSGLYGVFAISHWLLLPEAHALPLASVAASTAGGLAAFWLVLRRWALPATWAHAAGAGIASLVLLNSLLHLVLLGEAWQTTNLVLLVMGVGFFFLSTRWLTVMLTATGLGWGGAVWVSSPSPLWLHFGFALLTAGMLAVLVHTVRLRTYRRLVQLSLQDAERLRILEATARTAQHNAERFHQVFEHSNDAIVVINPSQEAILDANAQACQLLGYMHAELLQLPLTALHRVEDIPAVQAFVQATLDRGQGWTDELVCLTKTGGHVACEISAAALALDDTRCIISSIRDITERVQAEEALRQAQAELEQRVQDRTIELAQTNAALRVEITQHEQTGQALRESEARYRDFIESTHDMIYSAALDGRVLFVNRAWLTTLGYEPTDVPQLTVFDIIHSDSRAHCQQVLSRVAAGESVDGIHATFVTKAGRAIPVEGNVTARWVAGTVIGTQGFFRDVSEHHQAEAALRQREEYFRALIENASDVITVMGSDGTFQYQSPVAEQLLGHRLADAGRQAGFPFVHPDDTAKAEAAFIKAIQQPGGKIQTELRLLHQDGSWRTIEATVFNLLHNPAVDGIVANLHDITERKQAEAALRAAKEYAALLIHSSLDMIIAVDVQRRITEFNPAAEQTFGYRKAEVLGQPVSLLYADSTERKQVHLRTLQEDGFTVEVRNKRKTGEEFDAYVATSVMRDPDGQVVGVMGVSRDITEQKQAAAALRRSKEAAEAANRAKSEFLAMMSHEFRTPLHIILGYTELLTEGALGMLPAEALSTLAKVHTKVGELIELIAAVLDVSRMETETSQLVVELTVVSVSGLLAELQAETQDVQEQSGLDFVWQVPELLPSLATDPGKLKIVLKNLIGNAVKFTAQGHVSISAQSEAGGVAIAVADTGIGIPAEALDGIFEPFRQVDSSTTRPYGGVGLGLHIVKRLVELLEGTVTVASTVGQGSTFRVWVPATVISPTSPQTPAHTAARPLS